MADDVKLATKSDALQEPLTATVITNDEPVSSRIPDVTISHHAGGGECGYIGTVDCLLSGRFIQ